MALLLEAVRTNLAEATITILMQVEEVGTLAVVGAPKEALTLEVVSLLDFALGFWGFVLDFLGSLVGKKSIGSCKFLVA